MSQEPPSFAARSEWQYYWYVSLSNENEGCNTSSCYNFCCWKKWETGGNEHSNGSGAQISLVRNDVAQRLRLDGKDVTITMRTVEGKEKELNTKCTKF